MAAFALSLGSACKASAFRENNLPTVFVVIKHDFLIAKPEAYFL